MRRGFIPPTLHYTKPRPRCPVDPVGQDLPRKADVRHIVSTNSAFSGANAAVVVSRVDDCLAREIAEPAFVPRPLLILGVGTVGSHGSRLEDFDRAFSNGTKLGERVTDCNIVDFVPTADPRGLEPSSRFLAAASASALSSAGISLRGALRERAGIFSGLLRISPEAGKAFDDSIEERGMQRLSTTAFTRMVLNASAGSCAKLLQLKGPMSSLTTGRGTGLSVLLYAAHFLSVRPDVDVLLAGAVDEYSPCDDPSRSEGAACLVLGKNDGSTNAGILLAGWGLAGPKQVDLAISRACAMAGVSPDEPKRGFETEAIWGRLDAVGPLFSCIAAFRALQRGEAQSILIADDRGDSVSSAVVLMAQRTEENQRGS